MADPQLPETNMLDLGVWMALQSITEYLHKKKVMQNDVLAESMQEAFDEISKKILEKVHDWWKLMLKLIVQGKGSNNLVEAHHGLKDNLADLPTVPDCDSDNKETIKKLIKQAEDEDENVRNK